MYRKIHLYQPLREKPFSKTRLPPTKGTNQIESLAVISEICALQHTLPPFPPGC